MKSFIIAASFESDAEYALRFIFMVRDVREGLGERRLFKLCVKELLNHNFENKEAETSPPNRYNSGSMILAMENAGKLIEDEELREQIKGAGIGTSATRGEIIKKF